MFSKTNKRISLNPLDNRQYDNDTTPIMTDFTPPTPTTPAPAYGGSGSGRGRGPGGGGAGGPRTLRSAPIHLPSSQASSHNAPPTPRSPAYPRQQPSQQQYGGGGGGGGRGGGARRHNTYHQGHHQTQQHQLPRSARSLHHHHQKPPPSPMYPPSPSAPSFRSQELHTGYQSTPQMYSPTSPSFHNQYPPSPGSPLPPYVERPPMAVVTTPPQYTSREMSYGRPGGANRSVSDPELAMYENSGYYTNRNRKQQEQKELQRRRQQQQESSDDGECCGCFKSMAEFCPCLCFCCMFGGLR